VHQAKAVFIIASRGIDKDMADQHSILRSWAIKDFAPHTPQFVQLFRPENKINIKFAGNRSSLLFSFHLFSFLFILFDIDIHIDIDNNQSNQLNQSIFSVLFFYKL
jgi:hypothetical protein